MERNSAHFTEKSFTLVVYRTDSGRVISVSPMNKEINSGDNLYSRLDYREADMLRNIGKGFSRLPVLCVLDGKSVIVARSLQGRYDLGILFMFEEPIEAFLALAENGRLDLVLIDRDILGDVAMSRASVNEEDIERICVAYRLMINSLYNIEADEDVSGAIAALADLAGCAVRLPYESCETINKMKSDEKTDLLVLLFLVFLFVSREGVRRDVAIGVELRGDDPRISFTTELRNFKMPRIEEELHEFMRISDERGLLYEGVQRDGEKLDGEMRIVLDPKSLDFSLLGIKVPTLLEE